MEEIIPGKDLGSVDLYLEKRLKEQGGEPMEFWVRYQQGKLWTQNKVDVACDRFMSLAGNENFPLHKIALLRALETCPKEKAGLPTLETIVNTTTEPWLHDLLNRVTLMRAVRIGDEPMEMRMSIEVSRDSSWQSEKIQLLSRAKDLATKHQDSQSLTEVVERLQKIAPRFRENPKPQDYLDVAFDYRKARQFDQARSLYAQAIADKSVDDGDRYKALDGIRLAFKLEKRVNDYVAATQKLAEFTRSRFKKNKRNKFWIDKFHDTTLLLARTLWTERSVRDALQTLVRLEADLGRRRNIDEIHWMRARIEEEAGRFDSAEKILATASNSRGSDQALREKIRWYRAWNLYKLGRFTEALEIFKRINDDLSASTNRPRNRFWLAKTLQKLGLEAEAAKEFEGLVAEDNLGYYGMLGYRELGREIPAVKPTERTPAGAPQSFTMTVDSRTPPKIFPNPSDFAYVEWLLAVGENQIARRFLAHAPAARARRALPLEEELELLRYQARANDFQSLFARLSQLTPEVRSRFLDEDPSLLFPQPYFHFVSEAGRRFGVNPELIYAIMRQESSFDPQARSHADAFGLMQLIPEAARRVEGMTDISLDTAEDLYQPNTNVTLGAAFLRLLMDQYDEQFILTVASYNASEKAIRGWMRTRYRGDSLEFIEDIPYEETRGYVKLVLRNYIFYLRLNSGGEPVAFPEWCLQSLHDFNS